MNGVESLVYGCSTLREDGYSGHIQASGTCDLRSAFVNMDIWDGRKLPRFLVQMTPHNRCFLGGKKGIAGIAGMAFLIVTPLMSYSFGLAEHLRKFFGQRHYYPGQEIMGHIWGGFLWFAKWFSWFRMQYSDQDSFL